MGKFTRNNKTSSKLTASQVYDIREKYTKGFSQGALAREYGVGVGQIGRIVRGEAWQEFAQPEDLRSTELQAVAQRMVKGLITDEEIEESQRKLNELIGKDQGLGIVDKLVENIKQEKEENAQVKGDQLLEGLSDDKAEG